MNKNEKTEMIADEAEMMQFLKNAPLYDSAPPAELDFRIKAEARKRLHRPKMIRLFYTSVASLAAVTALCCGLVFQMLPSRVSVAEERVVPADTWDWVELETEMIEFSGELENMTENNSSWEFAYQTYGGMIL